MRGVAGARRVTALLGRGLTRRSTPRGEAGVRGGLRAGVTRPCRSLGCHKVPSDREVHGGGAAERVVPHADFYAPPQVRPEPKTTLK